MRHRSIDIGGFFRSVKGGKVAEKPVFWKSILSGCLAGAAIALGGTAFLSLENKVLGALFFCIGLFSVCTMGFKLFTGKVCYVFEKDKSYALDLIPIWLGNLAGAWAAYEGLDERHSPYALSSSEDLRIVLPDITYSDGVRTSGIPKIEFMPVKSGSRYDRDILEFCYDRARKAG